jgi:hypothetical protein
MAKYKSDRDVDEALRAFLASDEMHGIYFDNEDVKISVGKKLFNSLKKNELEIWAVYKAGRGYM